MTYIHFTEEQKYRASCVDLVEFLRRQGEKLIRSGPEYRMASDRSVTVRSNEWYDHASKEGGGPISFVQNYFGLSYPEAVTRLLDGEQGRIYEPASRKKEEPKKEFIQPPVGREMRRLYAYLLKRRLIDREVLSTFVRAGLVYEDEKYHNAVFAGKDEHERHGQDLPHQCGGQRSPVQFPLERDQRPALCIRGAHRPALLFDTVPKELAAAQLCGFVRRGRTGDAVDAGAGAGDPASHPLPGP